MDDQKDISAKYWLKFSAKITSGVSINSAAIQFLCQKCNVNHANIMWFLARHRHDQGETEIEVDENRKINCVDILKGALCRPGGTGCHGTSVSMSLPPVEVFKITGFLIVSKQFQ